MNEFHVDNKHQFADIRRARLLLKMRKHIQDLMLTGNESDFFDLDQFNRGYVHDTKLALELLEEVRGELHHLGWKTFLGFGGTGLYVYSTEEVPPGAY